MILLKFVESILIIIYLVANHTCTCRLVMANLDLLHKLFIRYSDGVLFFFLSGKGNSDYETSHVIFPLGWDICTNSPLTEAKETT